MVDFPEKRTLRDGYVFQSHKYACDSLLLFCIPRPQININFLLRFLCQVASTQPNIWNIIFLVPNNLSQAIDYLHKNYTGPCIELRTCTTIRSGFLSKMLLNPSNNVSCCQLGKFKVFDLFSFFKMTPINMSTSGSNIRRTFFSFGSGSPSCCLLVGEQLSSNYMVLQTAFTFFELSHSTIHEYTSHKFPSRRSTQLPKTFSPIPDSYPIARL